MSENKHTPEQDDAGLFDKITARTEELISSGKKNIDEALQKAKDELSAAGEFTREQAEKISIFVKKDIQHAIDQAAKAKDNLKDAVAPQRVAAGAQSLFAKVLSNTAETLNDWAQKSEQQLEFKTGEITSPGTLTCKNCCEQVHMKRTARIPPCPKCHKTYFRKSY